MFRGEQRHSDRRDQQFQLARRSAFTGTGFGGVFAGATLGTQLVEPVGPSTVGHSLALIRLIASQAAKRIRAYPYQSQLS